VRVLEVGTISKELCGGTHVGRTSEIGIFKISAEESVGANLRRVEAVTSFAAYEYTKAQEQELAALATELKVPPHDVRRKLAALLRANRDLREQAKKGGAQTGAASYQALAQEALDLPSYKAVIASPEGLKAKDLREVWDSLRAAGIDATILITLDAETGKTIYLAAATDKATSAGFNAGAQVKQLATTFEGRGGGKPTMAQGGSENTDKGRIKEALTQLRAELES
jgi:alanyl-tRNA synthetase